MIRISQRDGADNKKKLLDTLNSKFPKPVVDEFIGEFTAQKPIEEVEFSDKDMEHILPFIEKRNLRYQEPQMVDINKILEHSENTDLRSRISAFNDGTINTDNTGSSATYIRSPENINKFKSMDASTAPPIAVSGTGKLEWGFHRTIAAISRGDKEILAWVFE